MFEPEDVGVLVKLDEEFDAFEDEVVFALEFVGCVLLEVLLFVFVLLEIVLLGIVLLDVELFDIVLLDVVLDEVVFVVPICVGVVVFVEFVIGGITKKDTPVGLNPEAPTNANDAKTKSIAAIILFSILFLIYITLIIRYIY